MQFTPSSPQRNIPPIKRIPLSTLPTSWESSSDEEMSPKESPAKKPRFSGNAGLENQIQILYLPNSAAFGESNTTEGQPFLKTPVCPKAPKRSIKKRPGAPRKAVQDTSLKRLQKDGITLQGTQYFIGTSVGTGSYKGVYSLINTDGSQNQDWVLKVYGEGNQTRTWSPVRVVTLKPTELTYMNDLVARGIKVAQTIEIGEENAIIQERLISLPKSGVSESIIKGIGIDLFVKLISSIETVGPLTEVPDLKPENVGVQSHLDINSLDRNSENVIVFDAVEDETQVEADEVEMAFRDLFKAWNFSEAQQEKLFGMMKQNGVMDHIIELKKDRAAQKERERAATFGASSPSLLG